MSRQNSTSSQKSENKDLDEIEEEFLKCNIEDLPIPKEELEDYEYEIKEVMKSGCNRQIAEYALLQYKINTELQKLKDDYIQELNKIKEKIKDSIDNYFNNKGNIVIKRDTLDSKKEYEEEAEKILEENEDNISRVEENKTREEIIQDLIDIFTNEVNEYEDKDNFIDAKNEYTTKRDAIIESALRLVKKIVNNEEEYNIFYNNYYGKN